ncbi:MAG: hypothetical protein ACYTHJ_07370 [Planctomycetota bacterium]|jgi:hypothetical protein
MTRQRRGKGQGTLYKRKGQGPWIASWFDHNGKCRERSTRTTDRRAAELILGKFIADAAVRIAGVVDPKSDRYNEAIRKPIGQHVDDWIGHLRAKAVSENQLTLLSGRVRKLVASIKAERVTDIAASDVQAAIGELHEEKSLQTCQHYLRAIKQFSRWLHRDGRVREDVLAHLTGFNVATDRRHERRPLSAEELNWLIQVTEDRIPFHGVA